MSRYPPFHTHITIFLIPAGELEELKQLLDITQQ